MDGPVCRGQGIGSKLLARLVQDATETAAAAAEGRQKENNTNEEKKDVTLCLLTLRSTVPFYQRQGFVVIEDEDDVPRPLQAERAAGNIVVGMSE